MECGFGTRIFDTTEVSAAVFNPGGTRIGAASNQGIAFVWEVASGERIRTFSGHTGGLTDLAFSADGRLLATASKGRTVRIWDRRSALGRQGSACRVVVSVPPVGLISGRAVLKRREVALSSRRNPRRTGLGSLGIHLRGTVGRLRPERCR